MNTPQTLQQLLNNQCRKIQELQSVTVLIKSKHAIKDELLKMQADVYDISSGMDTLRSQLEELKEQNEQCKNLHSLITAMDKKIVHMEQNIPEKLIQDYRSVDQEPTVAVESPKKTIATIKPIQVKSGNTSMKDCKKTLFNEPQTCPMIPLITNEEFRKIPKYIIGRQSMEMVNGLVSNINNILKTKYTMLSMGKQHARKTGNLENYLYYKKQEIDMTTDNDYIFFFTGEDYTKQTNSKLSKNILNLFTVLRHCKRIREHRVKNDLRYVITPIS